MKRVFTLLAAILLMAATWAQAPQQMSYQAVIRNAGGEVVTTMVGMRISILKGSEAGTQVYVETQTPTPNLNGLVAIKVGGGNPTAFAAIDWSDGPYFIKTETDPAGGSTYSITGTSQLLSVPYALNAKNGFTRYIGELYGGGIIVAVWNVAGVEHGLIASLTDMSATSVFSNLSTNLIGATAQSPINGQANTTAIIGQTGHTASAAKLCDEYVYDVYTDWYLPAAWELNLCYNAAFVVNTVLGADGFNINNYYWSSSEAFGSGTKAHCLIFATGYSNYLDKSLIYSVRAVRRF
jgi:hypothetical protein